VLTLNEEQIVKSCAHDDKTPYRLVSRTHKADDTVIDIDGVKVGVKGQPVIIAGPCAVESREQLFAVAESVSKTGVKLLRGGAFKPRTSPYSFQGLGVEGLKLLREAAETFDLRVVTEVTDTANLDDVAKYAHVLQVGSRNMHNYALLKAVGAKKMPVLLKRGMSATIEEFLCAAEYLLLNGTPDVILCERGIRSFDSMTRNTLDLSAVALIKKLSHLPVIVDPSHACGRVDIIPQMSKAAIVAGADGLIIEVASDPDSALCDGAQSLTVDSFTRLTKELAVITSILPSVL
jgi:3-deoxy-7-phosphoheptulonate synthase